MNWESLFRYVLIVGKGANNGRVAEARKMGIDLQTPEIEDGLYANDRVKKILDSVLIQLTGSLYAGCYKIELRLKHTTPLLAPLPTAPRTRKVFSIG